MTALTWSDALELGLDTMDDTHREFVDLLALCHAGADDELPALWDTLVAHTADHFGREDRWMASTGFASENCHSTQHKVVLAVLREGARLAREGQVQVLRQMADELATWFPRHAQTMDAALALHLRSVGFDFEAGQAQRPDVLPAGAITGCGSGACS